MPDLTELKAAACAAIEGSAQSLYTLGDALLHTPELGYKKHRTAAQVLAVMQALGLEDIQRAGGTSIKAWLHGAKPSPRLCIMGAAYNKEFHISDKRLAYLVPAQLLAMTALDLLAVDAAPAKAVVAAHKRLSVEEYRYRWVQIPGGDI